MENNEKKEMELDITKIVLDVYTKVARWHNDDYVSDRAKGDALKIISHDIVQTIVDDIIGEDLPEVTDDLISRIKEFYDYPGLLQWLTKNKNKRIFVVYW